MTANELLGLPVEALLKPRNIFWDAVFYDITTLAPQDLKRLAETPDLEGAVIVVSPKTSGKMIRCYANATEMLKVERAAIDGVVVAGVGSSIVGTAALATNVADAYDIDVAGVVSGYGIADVMTDAMGGRFYYRYVDRFHHHIEIIIEKTTQALFAAAQDRLAPPQKKAPAQRDESIPRQLESGTLLDILASRPPNLKILVGHSKGALLIDYVLEKFVHRTVSNDHPYYHHLQIVTVGAIVAMPKEFVKIAHIMGQFDWLGGINSPPELLWEKAAATKPKYIQNAWHHLNKRIPFNLNLVAALNAHVTLH